MKSLAYPKIDQRIIFDRQVIYNLVIENPSFLCEFINNLRKQIDGDDGIFSLYNCDKEEDISKEMLFILNPFEFVIDEKKATTVIQKDLVNKITCVQKEKYELLMNTISDYLNEITYDYPISLSYDTNISIANFLKCFSISSEFEESTLFTDLLNNIKRISFINNKKIVCLYDIHNYFTNEELSILKDELYKLEIDFFYLSSHKPMHKLDEEFIIYIDEDLCELHIEPE